MNLKSLFLAAIVLCCFGFAVNSNNSAAKVDSYRGLLLFVECQPTEKFERVGSLKFSKFWATDNSFPNIRKRFVEKCIEKYPDADGIVMYLTQDENDYLADVVKFPN